MESETQKNVNVSVKIKITAKEFFFSMGMVISLYASVGAFLAIVFATLSSAFPDVLDGGYFQSSGIGMLSTPLSIIIILFPVFTLLAYFSNRALRNHPERSSLGFRRFAIWLTLFLSAGLLITDLVTLLNFFLNGEITTRFVLKVLVVIVTAVLVGWYCLYDLHRDVAKPSRKGLAFGIVAWVLVLAAIIFSFSILGSPQKQRSLTLDMERVTSLGEIEDDVLNYWQDHGKMPVTLADLSTYSVPTDPEAASGKTYEYIPGQDTTYQVCATFDTASPAGQMDSYYYGTDDFLPAGQTETGTVWTHSAGRTCFTRVIDPVQYPPNSASGKLPPETIIPD